MMKTIIKGNIAVHLLSRGLLHEMAPAPLVVPGGQGAQRLVTDGY